MNYIRICWAAINRYRLEAPIRAMWEDSIADNKKKRQKLLNSPFPVIVNVLTDKGYIDRDHQPALVKEYNRLSKILHGAI